MKTSIQSLDAPVAFRLPDTDRLPESAADVPVVRTFVRALEGMQKEAIVWPGRGQAAWRLICDEGHYLNGTDLAPPPLAFFSAGMVSIFAAVIARELSKSAHDHSNLIVEQDACYGMEGSALRGTMTASAESVSLRVSPVNAAAHESMIRKLAAAILRTPVESLLRSSLADTFSIERNGDAIATGDVHPSGAPNPGDPGALFARVGLSPSQSQNEDLVTKLESAESVFDADHGVGAALKDHQKRTLLIRSRVVLREDGLQQIRVQIHRPIGSVFQFLVDETANRDAGHRTPDGLSYMAAGIAFCYMTQLGRYIEIARKKVDHYNVVQDMPFDLAGGATLPVDTHVYLQTGEDQTTCRKIVDMAEQTCFLHAACRTSNKTKLHVGKRRISE